jgi:hypothetical protein
MDFSVAISVAGEALGWGLTVLQPVIIKAKNKVNKWRVCNEGIGVP